MKQIDISDEHCLAVLKTKNVYQAYREVKDRIQRGFPVNINDSVITICVDQYERKLSFWRRLQLAYGRMRQ